MQKSTQYKYLKYKSKYIELKNSVKDIQKKNLKGGNINFNKNIVRKEKIIKKIKYKYN
jgi:hypothetical protein